MLFALGDYGGPTPTHRLQTGSPAIDKGNFFGLTTDQRGFTRPVDNQVLPMRRAATARTSARLKWKLHRYL
ncbi:MAG: hypothetical protein H0V90_04965 [Blastocatellia bacterium]|nr:hypothetical protein [Blastocatellia bacterium]